MTAQDIILNPFTYSIDQGDEQDILQEHTHNAHMPDEKRQRLNQFMSTPKFIKCLTEISQNLGLMKEASKDEKKEILKREVVKLNQQLPATVYVPFVGNSSRNQCVLHIPPEEAVVF